MKIVLSMVISLLVLAVGLVLVDPAHVLRSEKRTAISDPCAKNGEGRSFLMLPSYLGADGWYTYDGLPTKPDIASMKELYSREIDVQHYRWLTNNVNCLPSMRPTVAKAVSDGKITWDEYRGPISAAHTMAVNETDEREYRQALDALKAALNPKAHVHMFFGDNR